MKTRVIILAGGEGTRLGVLTAKRTKPAVPFGGKYRIIDFPLSNCVNSRLFDVMILAQYRPHSLIEHLGSGGPWDLNRDFTGGVRILTPYRARSSDWYIGTADAVQQNFTFIKRDQPDLVLILSGDHIYKMDYDALIRSHLANQADVTLATIPVPLDEASRFGIIGVDEDQRVISFVEKPENPPSNLANMGVYLFNRNLLDQCLWDDHLQQDSRHDFGKDILPRLVQNGTRVFAYPFSGYWIDVGTIESYWQAHMDLLTSSPRFNLYDRSWIIHTRTEERPPARIDHGAEISDSLISAGCHIASGAKVIRSVLSPGVVVKAGSHVEESIVLTDVVLEENTSVLRSVLDKRAKICSGAQVGEILPDMLAITMVGKESIVPEGMVLEAGARVGTDVVPADYSGQNVKAGEFVQTRRLPYEL